MLHLRKLPTIYKNDMENYQIRRFEKATHFRMINQSVTSKKKMNCLHPQLLMSAQKKFFIELTQLNERKGKYLLFKYNKRGKSSQSSREGTLNASAQLVMVSLPYFCSNHNRRKLIIKKWKQIIWGVRIVIRYKYILNNLQFFELLNRLPRRRKVSSPTSVSRSPRKRRLGVQSVDNNFTLATKGYGDETNSSKTSRKLKNQLSDKYLKSTYYQDFKQKDQRLDRLRTNSLNQLQNSQQSQIIQTARTQSVLIRKFRLKKL
ncbi:unnamed protein product [Paramecium pentaurelia]|uniref:Uncharacterized protein n=1 Tax=Paramecium pentaurelia TaxID=43138 RepID=A0A8S1YAD1_9CILI|nr:unnamed protein product [Paramecium pentaurelia]